jgi:BON domain-containing protein
MGQRKRKRKLERKNRELKRRPNATWNREAEWDHEASENVTRWNPLRPGYDADLWSSQGELSGLGNFGPPYAPDWTRAYDTSGRPPAPLRNDWRAAFQGGFGNSGMIGESAYSRRMFGTSRRGPVGYGSDDRNRVRFEPGPERTGPQEGSWAERGFGPRGFVGGFVGHDYEWTRRGDRSLPRRTQRDNPNSAGNPGHGPHVGRGPKGYARPDDRVYEEVCERLTEHGGIDASAIEVRCEHGEVSLEGVVPDRETKRLAEEIAESARGVRDVHNRLRVGEPPRG